MTPTARPRPWFRLLVLLAVAVPVASDAQSALAGAGRGSARAAGAGPVRGAAGEGEGAARSSVASLTIEGGAKRMLVGATVPHTARVRDASGAERRDVAVRWTTSDPNIASVNQFGAVTAVRPGAIVLRVSAGGLSAERRYVVETNPIRSLTLSITADHARTGDVVEVTAIAFDGNGGRVPNVPFLYTFTASVEDTAVGQLAPAELDQRGRFVAQKAGDYQIIAVAPGLVAHRTVRVANRDVAEPARLLARAPIGDGYTSDLHAWRAADNRDYVMSCGAGSRGRVVAYDVTDPTAPRAIDTLSVDARGVGECAIDADARVAALVRQEQGGRSGIVVLDVSNPRELKAASTITEGLGAVHGVFAHNRHLFAVSDGRRLEVFNVEDPARPRRVGALELSDRAGTATDVWVNDGIAYVALGRGGVALADVGNGKFGGSLARPVRIGGYAAPFASTHAAYPYRSRTGKWYVITSEDLDAAPLLERGSDAVPASVGSSGFARIIDFTDPKRPEEVARYEVPEAGVQDLWVEGERLYAAAQASGLRVVDLSADLKGNLYHQGREIARYIPSDPKSSMPNAPVVVAAQPHQGVVYLAERHTGVWMVRVGARE